MQEYFLSAYTWCEIFQSRSATFRACMAVQVPLDYTHLEPGRYLAVFNVTGVLKPDVRLESERCQGEFGYFSGDSAQIE